MRSVVSTLKLADELTLEKAVEIGRNHETNLNSLKKLAIEEEPTMNIVNKERSQTRSRRKRSNKGTNKQDTEKKSSEGKERPDKKDKCGRCGYDKTHRNCPAMGRQCSFCKKINHYSKLCRSKQVHHLQEEDFSQVSSDDSGDSGDESTLFVYSVESNSVAEDEQFYETVEVEDTQVRFQLDSGAKANAISFTTYSSLKRRPVPPLRKTRTVLISFSKHKLKPRGEVVLTTQYKDKVENVKFIVVDTEVESVLSGNSCTKLSLLKRVFQLTGQELPSKRVELEDYPELFTGLGCLPGTYHIELAEGAVPVVHAPRKVPVPQRAKVVEELKRDGKVRSNRAPGRTN